MLPGRTYWFRSCPKCGGDLYLERDQYGPFIACLQCGYHLSESQAARLIRAQPLPSPSLPSTTAS